MRITVCGGGNMGHVCAGFLSSCKDNEVSLLTTHPERWGRQLSVRDCNGREYKGEIRHISSSPEEVIPEADIILLCLPGFAVHDVLLRISPFLSRETWVGTVVSSTGFFFEAMKLLPSSQPLFGFQRVPFISRIVEYGHSAVLKGYKKTLRLAVEHIAEKETIRLKLEKLFNTSVVLLDSYYEASLSNSNPLLHTARLYTMWKDWAPGVVYEKNPGFYSEWTIEAAQLLIEMDEEFQRLLYKLGLKEGSIPSVLDYYESSDAVTLRNKISSITAFKDISSPMIRTDNGYEPDFTSRYFTEDFPFGLRFIVETAEKNGVDVVLLRKVYEWGMSRIRN
ncbi:MAG: NAD/NADP octopine/nopaline dehydrogenase family protein [Bacteroidaceae bacterium]|nr:NAD/NADP octopine/nopaline dehydrogenase family protein [Bacteroidaceae bacterium]